MKNFNLPKSCLVEKFVPKKTFIEKTPKGKEKFSNIEKITWLYKLSPSTLHIEKHGKIEEIHIFCLVLKSKELPTEAIKSIKKLIPYPMLFLLTYKEEFSYATYSIERDNCFFSPWNKPIEFNFNETNLEKVYENMVKKFLSDEVQNSTLSLKLAIELEHKVQVLTKEIEALKKKISREKQFKKQLELSRILKPKERELDKLIQNQ
ncbi:MAG TPA: DUF4391 family protein [Campylobacterales bacterium]|nr:DUF4391 family protein [Sulfurospirillum arcachonense]HIP51196.1 DUF4391 family protein [Campylobacterales bacterium]